MIPRPSTQGSTVGDAVSCSFIFCVSMPSYYATADPLHVSCLVDNVESEQVCFFFLSRSLLGSSLNVPVKCWYRKPAQEVHWRHMHINCSTHCVLRLIVFLQSCAATLFLTADLHYLRLYVGGDAVESSPKILPCPANTTCKATAHTAARATSAEPPYAPVISTSGDHFFSASCLFLLDLQKQK